MRHYNDYNQYSGEKQDDFEMKLNWDLNKFGKNGNNFLVMNSYNPIFALRKNGKWCGSSVGRAKD